MSGEDTYKNSKNLGGGSELIFQFFEALRPHIWVWQYSWGITNILWIQVFYVEDQT